MITITVKYVPIITHYTKKRSENVSLRETNIKGLLNHLSLLYGDELKNLFWDLETGQRSKYVLIMVNGEVIHDEEYELCEGDTVLIFPAISGG